LNSINIKEILLIVSLVALFFIIIIVSLHSDSKRRNEIYTLINNPTFKGEVVGKESIRRTGTLTPITRYIEHRLHIVGEYIYDNELVQVDRVFIVPRYLYNKFDIGDLICVMP